MDLDWTFNDNNDGSQGNGGALDVTGTTTVNITAVNDEPIINDFDGELIFELGGGPVLIDADVSIFDPELSVADNFLNSSLTVSGPLAIDHVFGLNGQPIQDGQVTVEGVVIGQVQENSNGSYRFTFNQDASNAMVDKLVQSLTYEYTGITPPSATPRLRWFFRTAAVGRRGFLKEPVAKKLTLLRKQFRTLFRPTMHRRQCLLL